MGFSLVVSVRKILRISFTCGLLLVGILFLPGSRVESRSKTNASVSTIKAPVGANFQIMDNTGANGVIGKPAIAFYQTNFLMGWSQDNNQNSQQTNIFAARSAVRSSTTMERVGRKLRTSRRCKRLTRFGVLARTISSSSAIGGSSSITMEPSGASRIPAFTTISSTCGDLTVRMFTRLVYRGRSCTMMALPGWQRTQAQARTCSAYGAWWILLPGRR
jgi:hypothetical protein